MRSPRHVTLRLLALAAASVTAAAFLPAPSASAAIPVERRASVEQECFEPGPDLATSARGGQATDHRDITRAEQRAIERRTDRILSRTSARQRRAAVAAPVPVYVHVMAAKNGAGDVTDAQITQQIAVLNTDFAGQESTAAANTGFTFTLAGTDRFYNDTWHRDGSSTTYRKRTRQGGANALNIWLVDFNYLGIATFPWDYAKNPGIDGIRVQYSSLPGGSIANYDLGKTATHEAGHWFGLYHTFQGGCVATNDEVGDTPAQSSATSGCPEGRDSCTLPGLDPIHNYMDYSYDACYDQFTPGQSTRANQMFAAYRA
ncbi:zinc metalloprotease [Nocardioides rubriscoriae]|uniref:zinc metalloprotease n=1 Tax=Nocardioides rubriscoriae TaxID=642762 RepID=UPI001B87B033|nr:zinc metalloprotease [Nocardioides rubriscoriae]